MLQRFTDYIQQQHLFSPGEKVLLAVSGGRDSVCMAHLFHRAGIPFAVAHCNFHLRLGDCDRDQRFVHQLADDYGVPFFTADFDTRAVAASTGESIEQAARRLRYEFFSQTLTKHLALNTVVATAHHRDDSIETFFLNLFRGTGISGLHGIRPKSQFSNLLTSSNEDTADDQNGANSQISIVRPLLCFSRAEIDAYVTENHLEYVEDSTNALLDARRNRIRHRLMPLLRELYPSIDATMAANIERLYDTELIYKEYIETLRTKLITPYHPRFPILNSQLSILSLDLPALKFQSSILFELLRPYGFNASQVGDILAATENGKLFYSPTHVAEIHCNRLLIAPNEKPGPGRHPQAGDRIIIRQPDNQAIRQSKLLSDYLKDMGLSRIERQHLLLRVIKDGFVELITAGLPDRSARGDK